MGRRSKVTRLPPAIKAWLDQALVRGGFQGYELLELEVNEMLAEADADFRMSRSGIQRYGSAFDQRLASLKLASEQARAVVTAAPDEEGAVNEALMRLVQEHLFKLLVADDGAFDLPKVARAVADLGRATVNQNRWRAEQREKFRRIDSEVGDGKLSAEEALRRVREEVYGN